MLKRILIALLAIVAIFVVVVAMQPAEYRVERSATIAAPTSIVFGQVNDFHKWDAWSPWAKLDPNAKMTFEGPESGTGAIAKWSGNGQVGEGQMTLAESKPDELVRIKVEFKKPFEGSTNSEFNFKPEGDQTKVTWSMYGEHDFVGKAFCLILNGKKMMGEDIEKGLTNLKFIVEAAKPAA
jgi:hypothetical protein